MAKTVNEFPLVKSPVLATGHSGSMKQIILPSPLDFAPISKMDHTFAFSEAILHCPLVATAIAIVHDALTIQHIVFPGTFMSLTIVASPFSAPLPYTEMIVTLVGASTMGQLSVTVRCKKASKTSRGLPLVQVTVGVGYTLALWRLPNLEKEEKFAYTFDPSEDASAMWPAAAELPLYAGRFAQLQSPYAVG